MFSGDKLLQCMKYNIIKCVCSRSCVYQLSVYILLRKQNEFLSSWTLTSRQQRHNRDKLWRRPSRFCRCCWSATVISITSPTTVLQLCLLLPLFRIVLFLSCPPSWSRLCTLAFGNACICKLKTNSFWECMHVQIRHTSWTVCLCKLQIINWSFGNI